MKRALVLCWIAVGAAWAVAAPSKIRMSFDEDLVVTRLASVLGYFQQEGIEIVPVDITQIAADDYLFQEQLVRGRIDVAEHWFNHAVFGARHGFPIQAVLMLSDAPAMKVMVAKRVEAEVKSAADFKGRVVAEGAGYATKAVVTAFLAHRAGLPFGSYISVNHAKAGRLEAVLRDLHAERLDVLTFQEPVTSGLEETGLVSTLYDLTSRAGAERALGAIFPAQSLLVAPQFARDHPQTVQRLVNAYVRALRYVASHSTDEVLAILPSDFGAGPDRAAKLKQLRVELQCYAQVDFSFPARAVELVVEMMTTAKFDQSEEGRWRAGGDPSRVRASELYTNVFALEAMRSIK